jgi:hypothetical protein
VETTAAFMLSPLNLPSLVPHAGSSFLAPAARSGHAGSPAGWFEPTTVSADTHIGADLDPASRGLSVEQHAARVLLHLFGERDERA